jgi:ABC-2 type transport system ATP-binding protein
VELWPNLTGGEAIDVLGRLRGGLDDERRNGLIERFELDPKKKTRTYSKGNRQKVALVAALAADVELLILDEPTSGLDPLMEAVFQQVVAEAKAAGRTILLSSHILAQVETLADRITIIRDGKAVESGTLAQLRHLTRTTVVAETPTRVTGLDRLPGVHDVRTEGGSVRFGVDAEHLDAAIRHLTTFGIDSLVSHPPTLEELMLRHYAHKEAA